MRLAPPSPRSRGEGRDKGASTLPEHWRNVCSVPASIPALRIAERPLHPDCFAYARNPTSPQPSRSALRRTQTRRSSLRERRRAARGERFLNPRRVDHEIGEAAVAVVHAGEDFVDLGERRDAVLQHREIERAGRRHCGHVLAFAGGEPH